ncbi:MAG: O-antigen ligase family protein [Candidatus Cloacimonetes bacterium]|nr:O-antigen ligase family protein [Candidatus Cloacimonadota bacterium]
MFLVVFLVPLLFVIIIKNSNFQFNDLLILLRTIVIVAAFVGIVGVIMALINPTLRLGSLWITAMTINGFYLMAFFISLGLIMHNKTQQSRLFYIFISIFILLGMIFTYTRMSLLALGFGLFLLFIKIKKIRKYALYLVIFVPLIIPSSFHQRLSIGVMEDPSIIIRFVAWYNSIDLIKNNFFFGIGFNTWSHIYKKMIPMTWLYAEHPHNIYIRYILELGVFGFTAFFYIIIKTVFEFLRVINKNDYLLFSLAISILVLLFACLTDVFISRYPIAFIFWLILAIMIRIINDKKNFFLTTERV